MESEKNEKDHTYELIRQKLSCRGELQLTDYGISGIPVFQLSRHANYILLKEKNIPVTIDFLPDITKEKWMEMKQIRRMIADDAQSVETFFTGILNKKIMMVFLKQAGLKPDVALRDADPEKLDRVFELCKEWHVTVCGSNTFDQAQVCAGGVSMQEVTKDLESTIHKGLFFAGELLDVDGICGGYNLQWAWSSGAIAGKAASI